MTSIALPVTSHQFSITVGAGGTAVDFNWEFPIIYDRTEWRVAAIAMTVSANQTYLPLVPLSAVKLAIRPNIVSYNPDATVPLGTGTDLEWRGSAWGDTMSWSLPTLNIQPDPTVPERASIKVNYNYILPLVAVTPQVCNVTQVTSVVMESVVQNPQSTPQWGTPIGSGRATEPDFLPWLATIAIFGLIAVGGLFALGYASEKTGVKLPYIKI